ncbi:MAG: hypothetical protein FWF79_09835 [Defluviitaleaceae bacterium]|nr:hypothetical protein [Defluviitaleaceae bacterium]
MKFHVNRGWTFGFSKTFTVTDENGTECYTAKGNAVRTQLFDMSGKLLGELDSGKKFARASEIRKYDIVIDGKKVGMYNKRMTVLSYEYEFADLPWTFDRTTDEVKNEDVVLAKITDTASFFLHLIPYAPRKLCVEIHGKENEIPSLLIALGWHYYEGE